MNDNSEKVAQKAMQNPTATPIMRPMDGAFIMPSTAPSMTLYFCLRKRKRIGSITKRRMARSRTGLAPSALYG